MCFVFVFLIPEFHTVAHVCFLSCVARRAERKLFFSFCGDFLVSFFLFFLSVHEATGGISGVAHQEERRRGEKERERGGRESLDI